MHRQPLLICLTFFAMAIGISTAQAVVFLPPVSESEPNDTFLNRNVLPAGVDLFTGTITPGEFIGEGGEGGEGGFGEHQEFGNYDLYIKFGTTDPLSLVFPFAVGESPIYNGEADVTESSELFPGNVDFFSYDGLTPNTPFVVVMDNFGEGDTTLGWMDFPEPFAVIASDDDSSLLGDGLASSLSGTVDSIGELHLAVSGFPDFDFDGFSDDCDDEFCGEGFEGGDVDYVSFTGLNPGEFFIAESVSSGFDSVLGVFGNDGSQLGVNAFGDDEVSSALGGLVPSDGTLNFAVSGFADFNFFGNHGQEGDYTLSLLTAPLGSGELEIGDFVILPTDIVDGEFLFNDIDVVDGIPLRLDPEVAVGYEYTINGGGITFGSVQLPALVSDTEYELSFIDGGGQLITITIAAGDIYDFTLLAAGGVTAFTVNGINVGEMLDPNNPLAFLTVVTTVGSGTVDITQTAITVPEPATLLLMAWGLGIAASNRRRC